MIDYLLEHGLIVTLDKQRRIIRDGAIAIDGEDILDVGKTESLARDYAADQKIDARNKVVLPGLINSHIHLSAEHLVRGLVPDDVSSGDWFRNWAGPVYSNVTEEDEYFASLLALIECVKNGTTTVCDGGTIHSLPSVIKAFEKTGLKGVIGKWTWDIPENPKRMHQSTEQALSSSEEAVKNFDKSLNGRVRVWPMLVANIGLGVSSDLLVGAKKIADKYGVGVSMAQSSQLDQVEDCVRKTGKRPVQYFEELGVLGNHLLLIHMVHLNENEIDVLKKYDVNVVHCPTTALKSGYGFSKVGKLPEMLDRQICVSLGCDGAISSNHMDMFKAIYLAAGLYKDGRMDCNLIPAEAALEMGTINGARAILQDEEIGSLEKGKKADIVLMDSLRPEWTPNFNVVSNLVYSSDARAVDSVIVNGKMVVEKGKMIGLNEFEVYRKVQELGTDLIARANLQVKSRWPMT